MVGVEPSHQSKGRGRSRYRTFTTPRDFEDLPTWAPGTTLHPGDDGFDILLAVCTRWGMFSTNRPAALKPDMVLPYLRAKRKRGNGIPASAVPSSHSAAASSTVVATVGAASPVESAGTTVVPPPNPFPKLDLLKGSCSAHSSLIDLPGKHDDFDTISRPNSPKLRRLSSQSARGALRREPAEFGRKPQKTTAAPPVRIARREKPEAQNLAEVEKAREEALRFFEMLEYTKKMRANFLRSVPTSPARKTIEELLEQAISKNVLKARGGDPAVCFVEENAVTLDGVAGCVPGLCHGFDGAGDPVYVDFLKVGRCDV